MKKVPIFLQSVTTMLLHIVVTPLYFLGFILVYQSHWMVRFLDMGGGWLVFNTLMLTSILTGIISISRIVMTSFRKSMRLSWWQYALWSLAELIVFSAFAALYMALMYGSYGYFPALGQCFRIVFLTIPYPYIIFALLLALIRPDEPVVSEDELVRFTDNTARLKLVIAREVLLYVEAQENYIKIHYLDGEKEKEYSLRQSMRGIEELMEKHNIIRCQRSYYINPQHVKVLRRDKEGLIQAELDIQPTNGRAGNTVPVSPKYYEQLSKML